MNGKIKVRDERVYFAAAEGLICFKFVFFNSGEFMKIHCLPRSDATVI